MAAARRIREAMAMAETTGDRGTCPSCKSGDLISISMTVSGRELAFCTCHQCEAKWWYSDGEEVPLQSVIGLVVQKQ
jgi:DNA polymerase III alpha subunit (gram-positive type)